MHSWLLALVLKAFPPTKLCGTLELATLSSLFKARAGWKTTDVVFAYVCQGTSIHLISVEQKENICLPFLTSIDQRFLFLPLGSDHSTLYCTQFYSVLQSHLLAERINNSYKEVVELSDAGPWCSCILAPCRRNSTISAPRAQGCACASFPIPSVF